MSGRDTAERNIEIIKHFFRSIEAGDWQEAERNFDFDNFELHESPGLPYGGVWHGNTTQVDAFCIPLTIELGNQKLGINESRGKLFEAFRNEAPSEFKACALGDKRIVSPCRAGFGQNGPHAKYFDKYIDEVWGQYAQESRTPSGKWTGKVAGGGEVR